MKKLLLFFALVYSASLFAQEKVKGESRYGIDVTYQVSFLESKKKKDQHFLLVEATNNSGKDLYYVVKKDDFSNRAKSFAPVNVRNTKGVFANKGAFPVGEKMPFVTKSGDQVYKVKQGSTYKGDNKFSVAKGAKPIVTNEFPHMLQDLKAIDVQYISDHFISTKWLSDCGNFDFDLKFQKQGADTLMITQFVNGLQFQYQHTANGVFVRTDNAGFSITYALDGSSFAYASEDGVKCTWKRREER